MPGDIVKVEGPSTAALGPLLESARSYAAQAKSGATWRAYRCAWGAFQTWCDERGLPSLPADPGTVALYLSALADAGRRLATIQKALAALVEAQRAAGFASPREDARVREVLKGIRRRLGVAPKQKAPVLPGELRAMVASRADTLQGLRDRALLLLGFAGAFRRSELVALDVADTAWGEDGLTGIPRDVIGIPGLFTIPIVAPLQFYYFCVVIFMIAAVVKYKLIHSHFGMVLKTIRENESRARMVGYNVRKYKLASFIISAVYAAVAGTLYGLFLNYMFPQTLDWIRSGDVVIMTLIGGMGTFFGPIIGAGVVVALRVLISIYAKIGGLVFWQFFMGIIFLIFVLFFPRGIWGFFQKRE